jgi:serine/threonine/tyrosine-interacting protein
MADSFVLPQGVGLNGQYSRRPPSPPYIHVPTFVPDGETVTIGPPEFDSGQMSQDDLAIITQGRSQLARDTSQGWKYEMRRSAQKVLDFLYLGPASVVKDVKFLQSEGITMLLAARDSMMLDARLMSVEKVANELGLETGVVNISSKVELVPAFSQAVREINDHLIRVYRQQQASNPNPGGQGSFRQGKVLVYCETGNDRSAAIVAAYIMTIYRLDLVKTLQFVNLQRFCVVFDDETKFLLRSYEDILNAGRDVTRAQASGRTPKPQHTFAQSTTASSALGVKSQGAFADPSIGSGTTVTIQTKPKRHIEELMEDDGDCSYDNGGLVVDRDRLVGRNLSPFVDGDAQMDGA